MGAASPALPRRRILRLFCVTTVLPTISSFLTNPIPFVRRISAALNPAKCPSVICSMKRDDEEDDEGDVPSGVSSVNVLGTTLASCCADVRGTGVGTGFYRNGYCSTGEQDLGRHTVCVSLTDDFLKFSASVGNDLSTPVPEYLFPGLREGDIWCLCAQRWAQAYNAGMAPKLFLQATHEKTLDYVPFEVLREFAIDAEEADKALEDLNEQRARLDKLL